MTPGFTRPVDGSIPVQALLYNDEESLASQDGVGIYYGSQKSPEHQNGTIHITTHRLFYIDAQRMAASSNRLQKLLVILLAISLNRIRQNEMWDLRVENVKFVLTVTHQALVLQLLAFVVCVECLARYPLLLLRCYPSTFHPHFHRQPCPLRLLL